MRASLLRDASIGELRALLDEEASRLAAEQADQAVEVKAFGSRCVFRTPSNELKILDGGTLLVYPEFVETIQKIQLPMFARLFGGFLLSCRRILTRLLGCGSAQNGAKGANDAYSD